MRTTLPSHRDSVQIAVDRILNTAALRAYGDRVQFADDHGCCQDPGDCGGCTENPGSYQQDKKDAA